MSELFSVIVYLGVPAVLLLGSRHVAAMAKLGPIVLCYCAGLILGVTGLVPSTAEAMRTTVTEASLGLALPLLLFSVNVLAWRRLAGRALLSMFLAVASVVFLSTLLFYAFSAGGVERAEQLSGMAVGMYTGGIANLGAIKLALGIPDARYLLFATLDTLAGAAYLLFVLTKAPSFFARFLPAFDKRTDVEEGAVPDENGAAASPVVQTVTALVAAGACVAAAVLLAPMVGIVETEIAVITLLTTFGLVLSFFGPIRKNVVATKLGMYLIYVFSFCVAASLDLGALRTMDVSILVFILVALFGSLALHALLCRLMRVDTDTFLITSVAAIMSPAFVPMVARSLNNPAILMSGMATGILGFAIGNYLGIVVALLLGSGV
ncbi:DUF819 family protein [Shimia sp. SDUM112013]|uniref:DUF819 family protein n=1 Tax=Shimia sp. SDUM112013 TaxID=3136160 RepID=UPI0032ED7BC9